MTPGSGSQPLDSAGDNPFALLRLAPQWQLAESELRAAHIRLAAQLHPDRLPPGSAREAAATELARVNEAAALLNDPLRRAQILLALAGGAPTPAPSTEFLARMLELRDQLHDPTLVEQALSTGRAEITATCGELDRAFAVLLSSEHSPNPGSAQSVRSRVAALLVHWKYLRRLLEEGGS